MDEYIPTTYEMRIMHTNNYDDWEEAKIAGITFDLWLTEHDAANRTAALEEAADEWSAWETFRASDGIISIRQHGQTVKEWLRARAAKVGAL